MRKLLNVSAPPAAPLREPRCRRGYRRPARHVIHTVGPFGSGGNAGEPHLLARCYRSCLDLALALGLKTVAFPSISTGAYGNPVQEAARIALRDIRDHLQTEPGLERVVAACRACQEALRDISGDWSGKKC